MRLTVLTISLAFLTACSPEPPDDRAIIPDAERALPGPSEGGGGGELAEIELCNAADYRDLLGTDLDAAFLPTGPNLRVFGVNDIVTQEYLPERTNIVFDSQRLILRVYCG